MISWTIPFKMRRKGELKAQSSVLQCLRCLLVAPVKQWRWIQSKPKALIWICRHERCTNSKSLTGSQVWCSSIRNNQIKPNHTKGIQRSKQTAEQPRLVRAHNCRKGDRQGVKDEDPCHLEEYFLVTVWRSFWDACWPSSLAACSMLCGDSRLGGMEGRPGGCGGGGSVCTTGGRPILRLLRSGRERYGHTGALLLFKDWY